MGHFIIRKGHELFVDEDGRAWNNESKAIEFNPDTFEPLDIQSEPIIAETVEPDSSEMKNELEAMDYNELLELADMKRGPGASRDKAIAKILGA